VGTFNYKRLSAAAAALVMQMAAPAIWAQTATPVAADEGKTEEIVVTARKRDESNQDVPISINVFSEQAIEAAGIEKPGDFISLVPNMTLVQTQNAGNAFVVVRGISQARNSEPSVAVLVDGVLETNPAEFNQELFDIQQIEVLKGPQGALYGRNAIGGAIIIHTKDPPNHFEGNAKVGVGNGPSERAQVAVGGPMSASGEVKFRASASFFNTAGYIDNQYLHSKADPSRNYDGRWRLDWKPSDAFSLDWRVSAERLRTQALYFVIPRSNEAIAFTTFSTLPDANNISTPITLNNSGVNTRDLMNTSVKLDYKTSLGTVTSITAFDKTRELLTGDAYDFRPPPQSIFVALGGSDLNQSQFLDVKAVSQELRFTSQKLNGFSWIAGGYFIHTNRFISTGNMVDTGAGVFPVYDQPRLGGNNPSATYLADGQLNNAWALFGDITYEVTPKLEFDAALRYDQDKRKNFTDSPAFFLAQVKDPNAFPGEVREHTFSKLQPKGTIRYKLDDQVSLYGGWSRGFRSGGFNQTGVGAVAHAAGVLGVNDLYEAEVADTFEIGAKSQWLDRRLMANVALFHTRSRNGYFFVFLAANSTQNLGNLDATYKGAELELAYKAARGLDLYANFGYTDSEITGMEDPKVIGNQAPLVSRTSINLGAQYRRPITDNLSASARVDFQQIGRTWWEPYNQTSRDPISLVDVRFGIDADAWSVTAWSKNLFNRLYNAEFSPTGPGPASVSGPGFLFKAQPRTFGIDFTYRF
jgi:iron complex outermembrane recepter protein